MAKTELVQRSGKEFSRVLEVPPARPEASRVFYQNKLEYETDPSDVRADVENGVADFVIVDARSMKEYEESHVPGALNIPYRSISKESTTHLARDKLLVLYCWGPGCNAATKAAVRFSSLGFKVKEMIGGIEYWRREGYPLEGTKNKPLQA